MGGNIWLRSQPGAGSTFYFSVPLQYPGQDKTLQPVIREKEPEKLTEPKSILVAEDEPLNYLLIEEILKPLNVEIIHAFNGQDAVEYCRRKSGIGLVIMDLKMPVMDGMEAARIIKNENPEIPVVAITAYPLQEGLEEAREYGFDDYIAKPFRKQNIEVLLKKFLASESSGL